MNSELTQDSGNQAKPEKDPMINKNHQNVVIVPKLRAMDN